jgi:hypothetical protein
MNDFIKKGKKIFTFTVVLTTIVWSIGIGALALPLAANAVTSGDLIKGTGSAVYYYGSDGKRYLFPNQATYLSWYSSFTGITTLSDADLIALPLGGNVTVKPSKLAQFVSMDSPWHVMDSKIYAVEKGGVLRWVTTAAIAEALFGASWESQIVAVPEVLSTNFTVGADITAASDYNLSTQQAVATINEDKGLTGVSEGGALTVALASDTPAATSVPKGAANTYFTKVNFTAGATGATITGLKVTHSGLGIDSNINAVKLFVDGVQRGTSQSLGSVHQATFSLTSNPIVIPAGTTVPVYLAADIIAGVVAFDQHVLGIANVADITTTSSISGTFPINGNTMSLANVVIGVANLYNGALHPTADTGVDPAAVGFRFTQVKISADATEALNIDQIIAIKNGTAANTDVKNITLYNDTAGAPLGTVTALDANGRAVFSNLGLTIDKGGYIELSIKADMNGGSGRTIAFDLNDGTSYTMMIKGATYGFGILPVRQNFCAANGTCQTQGINQGYLTVSKSASAPATGKIAVGGTSVPMMAFDFAVAGEPVNITQTVVNYTTTGATVGKFTNWTLYKADGTILAGPKNRDVTIADIVGTDTVTFTDSYTLPVGTTVVYAKADVSSAAAATNTVHLDMAVGAVTGKGANSGKVTYTTSAGPTVPPAAVILGNTMTLQGPVLSIITAATPVIGNMVVNAQDQIFAYIDLDASGGGENLRVSSVEVTDTMGAGINCTGINNLELWGDPDTTDTTAENVRLTTSNSTATMTYSGVPTVCTQIFTFQTPIIVSKTAASRLTLKADVVTATGVLHTFAVAAQGDVVATGKDTGNAAAAGVGSPSGGGQPQIIQASGTLKVEAAADAPSAAQLVSSSLGNEVMKYKFTTQYEPIDVTEMLLFCGDNTQGGFNCTLGNVSKIYVYADGVLIGNTSGYSLDAAGRAQVVLASGTLVIPKDSYKTITLKIDLPEKTQVQTSAGADLQVGIAAGDNTVLDTYWGGNGSYLITATGQSSGAIINPATINNSVGATIVGAADADAVAVTPIVLQTATNGLETTALAAVPFVYGTDGAYIDVLDDDIVSIGDIRVAVGNTPATGLGYAIGSVVALGDTDEAAATPIVLQTATNGLETTAAAAVPFVFGTDGAYIDTVDDDAVTALDTRVAAGATAATGLGYNSVYGSNGFSEHKGILTVSLNASSPSGTQTTGANKEVLRLNLTATGDNITIRELELENGGTAGITGVGNLTVKSDDLGTTYATLTGANCNTYSATGNFCLDSATAATIAIGSSTCTIAAADATGDKCAGKWTADNNLQISAGTTKVIRIFGDTSGAISTKTYQMTVGPDATNPATVYGVTYRDSSNTDVGDRTGGANSTYPATKNLPLTGGGLSY